MELSSGFDPKSIEAEALKLWFDLKISSPEANDADREPYTIVIPPPNVTGALHIGHALNNTLQDILIRYKRMDNRAALWLPGSDHAGIATQNVVERELAKEGLSRSELGRAEFEKRVWAWKEKYGAKIIEQLKRLGASCDWDRERFTMDPILSRATREVFVRLYNDGLIYKGEYIINWCPRCHTALSDIEVEHIEREGSLWSIRYRIASAPEKELIIATTRPETMLGDTAVAVHPDDERYKDLHGAEVIVPLIERRVKIIADPYVDPEFGVGALKITPAHDPNDFALGKKHNLELIKIFDETARVNSNGGKFEGLERYEARAKIIEELAERGALVKTEKRNHAVGSCYRCETIVEPYVSEQWFVRMKPLAEPAIEAVKSGRVKFVPKNWEKSYFAWMENIHDWCISRQLWWGHRIPAWRCSNGHLTVAIDDPSACSECGSSEIAQEEDVLDTWFSSALWPFATLGWPDQTEDLKRFYPTSVLVTSFDIIFFWVARMIMMGLRFVGSAPFAEVYIHALARDERGRKMSKSLGNTIDPIEVIDRHGADALRMTLSALAAQGRDIKLSENRIEGYRAFCNKLWNAARFLLSHVDHASAEPIDRAGYEKLELADRWIFSRFNQAIKETREALDRYRFNEAAGALYQFIWRELCDWYIEIIKPRLTGEEPGGALARRVALEVFTGALKALHPITPFITEALWGKTIEKTHGESGKSIALESYPIARETMIDAEIEKEMAVLTGLVSAIRNVKGELGLKPNLIVDAYILSSSEAGLIDVARREAPFIEKLARSKLRIVESESELPENVCAQIGAGERIFVDLADKADARAWRVALEKKIAKLEKEIVSREKKLQNKNFIANAPEEIVEKDRAILSEALAQKELLALRLGG